jgi:hypothetical protein
MQDTNGPQGQTPPQWLALFNIKAVIVSVVFGLAALALVAAQLTLPIPGTGVVTDPREVFTTTGAALTGPVGGILIGVLAGIREPGGLVWASMLAHISGGLWMGLSYKHLVHNRLKMPAMLGGWAALVLGYYYVFVIPGFVIGQAFFYPGNESLGDGRALVQAYVALARGASPEAFLTLLVTTLVFYALPRRHRRPLW